MLEEKFNGFMLKRLVSYAADYKGDYIKVILLLVGIIIKTQLHKLPEQILPEITDNFIPKRNRDLRTDIVFCGNPYGSNGGFGQHSSGPAYVGDCKGAP